MKAIKGPILLLFTMLAVLPATADEYSDLYIIPGASHSHGAFGTSWRSDVVLHNMQLVPIKVEIALVESGLPPAAAPLAVRNGAETSVHLDPGETRVLADILGHFGRDLSGSLILGAELPFVVTSRTWAELPGGRTLGQALLPVAITGAADAVNERAVLPALADGGRQRTNIGVFAAASRAPLVIEIALLSDQGAPLGSQLIVLDEPGFVHRQLSLAQVITPATGVTAVVRIVNGDGIVVPYASIVDNVSAEAVFVSGRAASVRGTTTRSMLVRAVSGVEVK